MGEVDVYIHVFLTSALDGGEWSASPPLYPRGKSHRYPLDRWLCDPRTGLDDMEKGKFLEEHKIYIH
jgi:hypothetical protein